MVFGTMKLGKYMASYGIKTETKNLNTIKGQWWHNGPTKTKIALETPPGTRMVTQHVTDTNRRRKFTKTKLPRVTSPRGNLSHNISCHSYINLLSYIYYN